MAMKPVTLNIPDSKYSFFLQLVKSLNFVQVVDKESESSYSPALVEKIQKSRQEYHEGNFVSIEKENLKGFLGIE